MQDSPAHLNTAGLSLMVTLAFHTDTLLHLVNSLPGKSDTD